MQNLSHYLFSLETVLSAYVSSALPIHLFLHQHHFLFIYSTNTHCELQAFWISFPRIFFSFHTLYHMESTVSVITNHIPVCFRLRCYRLIGTAFDDSTARNLFILCIILCPNSSFSSLELFLIFHQGLFFVAYLSTIAFVIIIIVVVGLTKEQSRRQGIV